MQEKTLLGVVVVQEEQHFQVLQVEMEQVLLDLVVKVDMVAEAVVFVVVAVVVDTLAVLEETVLLVVLAEAVADRITKVLHK